MINNKCGLYINTDNSVITKSIIDKAKVKKCIPESTKKIVNIYDSYIKLSKKSGKVYRLARGYFKKYITNVDMNINTLNIIPISDSDLGEHQHIVINDILMTFKDTDYGDYLLQMNTGLGKTRVGIALISYINLPTIVVVPTCHIAKQWEDEIKSLIPTASVAVSPKVISTDIVIYVTNTATKFPLSKYGEFGLIIIDEIHEYTSPTKINILWNSSSVKYRVGLTATPQCVNYNLLNYIIGHMGSVHYSEKMENFNMVTKIFNANVYIHEYKTNGLYGVPMLSKNGNISTMETISRILSDPNRHSIVMKIIKQLYDDGLNILVFAEHRSYVDKIYEDLNISEKYLDAATTLKGGTSSDVIDDAINKRVIVTTYGYSRRGVSYNHLNSLVIASPRRNGTDQLLGRITRFNSDNSIIRTIIDISDIATVVKSQVEDRIKVYKEKKYKIYYK